MDKRMISSNPMPDEIHWVYDDCRTGWMDGVDNQLEALTKKVMELAVSLNGWKEHVYKIEKMKYLTKPSEEEIIKQEIEAIEKEFEKYKTNPDIVEEEKLDTVIDKTVNKVTNKLNNDSELIKKELTSFSLSCNKRREDIEAIFNKIIICLNEVENKLSCEEAVDIEDKLEEAEHILNQVMKIIARAARKNKVGI